MSEGVKARFLKGAIVPLEPLDIEEGSDLSLTIDVDPKDQNPDTESDEMCFNQKLDELYIQDYFEKSRR